MFSNVEFNATGFNPTENSDKQQININKRYTESSSQTEIKVKDVGSQSVASRNLKVQTEEVIQSTQAEYDVDKLASFLNKVYPNLMKELDKVEKSKAFSLYQPQNEQNFENKVSLVHTIQSEAIPQISQVRVSCITWSCTDNVVILGYESTEHSDWCAHSSSVDFFNIKMSDFNGKTPTYSIPTSSCVSALAAHPYEPSIVAVGTVAGEVHIWNLQKGQFDADMGNSLFHEDRITKLSWENINSQLFLVSSSIDSYIFFYKVSPSISSIQLHERYLMTADPSLLRAGVLSFSFSSQPGVFVVALENGELIHCSTFGAPIIPSKSARNPMLRVMCKKNSLAIDVKFSPFNENMLITTFTNNRFLGFSLKETAPLFEIFTDFDIFGFSWSKSQANIFFLWGKSSSLNVYQGDSPKAIAELQQEDISLDFIKSVSFCLKSSRLALSGSEGKTLIWDIPPYF